MTTKHKLSAVIIAKNEAERIGLCLDALAFCDERIVADNGSDDDTVRIAREHGAAVVQYKTDDFARLRNEALKRAKGAWVLYIDADEVVSGGLSREIREVAEHSGERGPKSYLLRRINYYLGQRWPGNEWMLRLFSRDALVRWEGELHETPVTTGLVGRLNGELKHDTHRSLSEMVAKTNQWSETEALLRLNANHPPITWWRLLRVTVTGFFHSFVTLNGWRAGTIGWIESLYQGFSLFITYAKLWEMQRIRKTEKTS